MVNIYQYLKNKWYGRLIKVISVIFYAVIIIISAIYFWDKYSNYDPIKLKNVQNIILENSKIILKLEEVKSKFPEDVISINSLTELINKDNLNNVDILALTLITIEYTGKDIDRVSVCGKDRLLGCSGDPVGTYIIDAITESKNIWGNPNTTAVTISNNTYNKAKEYFERTYKIEKDALGRINNLLNKKGAYSSNNSLIDFDNIYGTNTYVSIGSNEGI